MGERNSGDMKKEGQICSTILKHQSLKTLLTSFSPLLRRGIVDKLLFK
jgi:hypothetical protein